MPESVAANTRGRSFKILAEVDLTSPDAEGVIFAHGSRFGGHALFLKDKKLWYVYNFLGIPPEQQLVSEALEPGSTCSGWSSSRSRPASTARRTGRRRSMWTTRQSRQGRCAPSSRSSRSAATASASAATPRTRSRPEYRSPYRFKGGTIVQVEVNVGADQYVDLEKAAAAMLARE